MAATWFFPKVEPHQIQGRGLAEDNFAQESRTSLEILIREALQNPLDAPAEGHKGPIRVSIRHYKAEEFDAGYLRKLLPKAYADRLALSGTDAEMPEYDKACILVIEDFGTTGLEGTYENSFADGNRENWNAFWFREGEGAKAAAGSNGRAGQGKITYYRAGAARALFGLTVRQSDGKQLLLGRSSFRRMYTYKGERYLRDAFWCCMNDGIVLPSTDEGDIEYFRKAFKLQRDSEPGLSIVIPFAIDFDEKEAIRTVISEYYFPIARGSLEVTIGEKIINADNIRSMADILLPDNEAIARKSSFTKGFRAFVHDIIDNGNEPVILKSGWEGKVSGELKDDAFPEGAAEILRSILGKGEAVRVRCPLKVKPKKKEARSTYIDVYLQLPEDGLERVEEAYIRRDLLIGSESQLLKNTYLPKARGLTLIEDSPISEFLADAEEPTHLKWNASRIRLAEDYQSPKELVHAVRTAMPRVLAHLLGGTQKKDIRALAKYFTKPGAEGKRHMAGGKSDGDKQTEEKSEPPPSPPKPFRLETGRDWLVVRQNGKDGPKKEDLPMECLIEIAYEGLDLDPFAAYDPFDFDLSDVGVHNIKTEGITVKDRSSNRIIFEVTNPECSLHVDGFDSNIRLRARLTYEEKKNGQAIDAE